MRERLGREGTPKWRSPSNPPWYKETRHLFVAANEPIINLHLLTVKTDAGTVMKPQLCRAYQATPLVGAFILVGNSSFAFLTRSSISYCTTTKIPISLIETGKGEWKVHTCDIAWYQGLTPRCL